MLKKAATIRDNSVVFLNGTHYYVIDRKIDQQLVLLQSFDGKNVLQVPSTIALEVIAEPMIPRIRGFEPVSPEGIDLTRKHFSGRDYIIPDTHILPTQGTTGSAGYDFATPVELNIKPEQTVKFFTNIKAYMQPEEMLLMAVRSSVGMEDEVILANILTIVDEDYYNNPTNEGNIGIALRNTGNELIRYKLGDRICQAIFVPFLRSDNCNTDILRTSGVGHTGR